MGSGSKLVMSRSFSHWNAKFVDQRFRLRLLEHALDLLLQNRRVLELALFGDGQELVVRNAAPQKE